ncbi:Detected protein of unknown function [Hibiscus syriacus]|uniref:Uncharacterized protein n=1 Tax=Hibiscus syriacus TaxID=106335 RepID=A0A6A2ZEX6_HIBSY|nr:Detected protein of unknown function [Hibiscus syriacus]
MRNQLQELEKQLLVDKDNDNDNDNDGDTVSVITNANNEWSETETIQNLLSSSSPNNPIATSPTSSLSSSTTSVASRASTCLRKTKMEYVNLLYALSEGGIAKTLLVKITAVADNGGDEVLKMVGDKLNQIAKQFEVCLKFNVITNLKLNDLSRDSLRYETDESLAVNFAFKLYQMPDESVSLENPRYELLRQVKILVPRVVTLVEQEMNIDTAPFTSRW